MRSLIVYSPIVIQVICIEVLLFSVNFSRIQVFHLCSRHHFHIFLPFFNNKCFVTEDFCSKYADVRCSLRKATFPLLNYSIVRFLILSIVFYAMLLPIAYLFINFAFES